MKGDASSVVEGNANSIMNEKKSQLPPVFEAVAETGEGTLEGYKIQQDQGVTKTRKRNKKRNSKKSEAVPLLEYQRGALNKSSANGDEETGESSTSLETVSPTSSLVKAASSSSYAAVVSGRTLLNGNPGLEVEFFAPVVSSHMDTQDQSLAENFVMKRDVGIQVNISTESGNKEKKYPLLRSQWTMTSKKGQLKDKCVSAKICCADEEMDQRIGKSPVQFVGDNFSFQNTIAKSVAQLGITFGWMTTEEENMIRLE